MSRSLFKLIDYALVPAALLILAKLAGIFLVAALFSVNIQVNVLADALLSFETVVNAGDLPLISSYSDLFAFSIMSFGLAFILISAVYFHDSHIKVSTVNKLAKFDLLHLIKGSFELYHSGIVWLIFLWLANLLILINVIKQSTYLWILLVTVIFSISLTVIFFRDLFQEIELVKKNPQ